jgi:hypothetical protein
MVGKKPHELVEYEQERLDVPFSTGGGSVSDSVAESSTRARNQKCGQKELMGICTHW